MSIPVHEFLEKLAESDAPICDELKPVVEAIRKQKKKKVEPYSRGRVKCPICGNHQLFMYQDYCGDCGQHLDWSEWVESR